MSIEDELRRFAQLQIHVNDLSAVEKQLEDAWPAVFALLPAGDHPAVFAFQVALASLTDVVNLLKEDKA